jgi:hypothetical protein
MKSTVFRDAMPRGLVGFIDVSDECTVQYALLAVCLHGLPFNREKGGSRSPEM